MTKLLEQVIKDSLSSNKCKVGTKEVLHSIKNSQLIICSQSLSAETRKEIERSAKSANVPIYNFTDTSAGLGRLCNKPFRISILSIDRASNSDISGVLEEINK